MWMPIITVDSSLLIHLVEPAARSLFLAAMAGLTLAVLRVKAAAVRAAVWRGVLVAALAMPFIAVLAPSIRIPIPVPQFEPPATTTAAFAAQSVPIRETHDITVSSDASVRLGSTNLAAASTEQASAGPTRSSRPIPWFFILSGFYFFSAFLLFARIFAGATLANRLVRAATPVGDAATLHKLAACARKANLRMQPILAESDNLLVPVTLRVRRPAILLPASWREWDEHKLTAVLMHEISHVRRRDTLVQSLALIHRAIFWFSPLGWWLERHLADLAEQASDEAALSCGVERTRYAEALLGFIASLEGSRSRVWWQGVAMAKCGRAEKRIDRILAWRNAMPNDLKKSVLVSIAVLAAPLIALTASLHPSIYHFSGQEPAAPAAPQAPPAPAQPAPSAHPVVNPGPAPQAPGPGPAVEPVTPTPPAASAVPAVAPVAPAAPAGPSAQALPPLPATPAAESLAPLREQVEAAKKSVLAAQQQVARANAAVAKAKASDSATAAQIQALDAARAAYQNAMANYEAATQEYRAAVEQEDEAAAAVTGGVAGGVRGGARHGIYGGVYTTSGPRFVIVRKNSDSVIMSGSSEDEEHAKGLRNKIPGDFIWFEHDEKPYIVRDQATVDRALKLWEPQEELGRQQEVLGKQQEALGEQQEALGRKMEEVRVKIPDLSAQMEKLEARMKELSANGGTMEQIGDLQSQIGELQSRIGEIQSEAGSRQSEIGRQQGELGRKQGELGRQQGELGRRQGELARQASQQMKQLLDDAIAKGLAQPE